jgi:predicted P-loop ATPase
MAQMLLVNLDEFNAISQKKQEGLLKNIVQLPSVKVKRPYGRHIEEVPRLASFIATTNLADVLTDPSGSRRFVGVQVTGDIDLRQTPNYEQLYAQALAELDDHIRYWFDDRDNALVMQHNLRFQQRTSEEEFFYEYLAVSPDEATGEWMSAASIITYIKSRAHSSFRLPTPNRMGRILTNLPGMIHKHTMQGEQYLVVKR